MADRDPSLRPRLPRASTHAEQRHANAKSSLSLKWEDFFGTSVDLTSGVLNAFDTIATEINIDESLIEEEDQREHNLDVCDQLGSSPTDIVLLNALPATTSFRCRGVSKSTRHYPDMSSTTSTSLMSNGSSCSRSTLPRDLPSQVPINSQRVGTASSYMDSGYASEEAVFSTAAAAAGTTLNCSSNGAAFRSATLPCRGRAGAGSRTMLKDLTTSSSGDRIVLDSCSSSDTASTTSAASMEKASRVVQELVETERAYVNDLSLIVEGYMEPMRLDKYFAEESVTTVFGVLPNLWSFHQRLLAQLVDAQVASNYSALSECFLSNREHFHYYSHYCTNFPRSLSHLQELYSESQTSADFFATRQKALNQMLPLQTFLLKPVQRILKYHLLLQSLVKMLTPAEQPQIEQAAICMTDVASQINDLQRRHEHALRVRQLQSLLKSAHLDLGSLGELVLEDSFRLYGKKGAARQVFLFHKAILLGKRLESGMLAIKEVIRCANLMLIESIPKEHLSFHVLPFDNPKAQQTLQARTLEQKRRWCQEIKRLILENYNTAIPEKAKQLVLSMSEAAAGGITKRHRHEQQHCFEVSEPELQNHTAFGSRRGPPTATHELSDDGDDEFNPQLPMSRCFSSSEDLVTIHEEAWQELLRRTVHNRSEEDSMSSSSSQTSDDALFDDLRCIAVEINEERLDNNRHHRRQQSAGKASYILRAAIDSSLSSSSNKDKLSITASSKMTAAGEDERDTVIKGSKAPSLDNSHNPVYIHCPKRYDHLVFGKAYQEYIEKTKTMSALSPADIDEIFKPLKELQVQVEARTDDCAARPSSQASSADSSPRRVVSRIATSNDSCPATVNGCADATSENCHSHEEELYTASPHKNGFNGTPVKTTRSNSVMGTIFGGIKSALHKTNSSSNTSIKHHGSSTSIKDAGETLRHDDSSHVVRSQSTVSAPSSQFFRNRPEKPLRKTSSGTIAQQVDFTNTEDAALPLPRLPRGKNNSHSQRQDDIQLISSPRTQSHSPKPLHHKTLSGVTTIVGGNNLLLNPPTQTNQQPNNAIPQKPPLKPPALSTALHVSSAQTTSPQKTPKRLPAPSVPTTVQVLDESNSATLRRKKKQAPEPPHNGSDIARPAADERVACRGKIQAAITDLMDSLPYADDEHNNTSAETLDAAAVNRESRRATGEWAVDNVYWKRALLDTRSPAAVKVPSLRPAPRQIVINPGPSKVEPVGAAVAAGEEVAAETPKRGTVANMISRFQHAT